MQDNNTQGEAQLSRSLETAAATIAERCFQDKEFGKSFLENPKAALASQNISTGQKTVHAHENDARNWHIVLPHLKVREALDQYSAEEMQTMKDSDLRKIAGGEVVFVALALGVGVGSAAAVTATGAGVYYGAVKKKKK